MAQDIISDALNMIMNANKVEKKEVVIKRKSKLLIELLKMLKQRGHIDFQEQEGSIKVEIKNLNECKAIKPRFSCDIAQLEKYRRRYLPARNLGTLIISTNKGLMTHEEADKEKIGGCLIAYFY